MQQNGQIREEDVREVQHDSDANPQEARRLLWQVSCDLLTIQL